MAEAPPSLRRATRRVARRRALRGKKVVLFPAGLVASLVKDELERSGVEVHAVIDNDPEKEGRTFRGLVVQRPETVLVPFSDDYVIVVVGSIPAQEMLYQLETLGYRRGRRAFLIRPVALDTSMRVFLRACVQTIRGAVLYRRLSIKGRRVRFLVMPYPGTGDMYLVELFLRAFLERQTAGEDHLLIVPSKRCAQVARMMGEQRVLVAKQGAIHSLISYSRFMRLGRDSVLVLNEGWAPAPTQWLRGFRGLNFEQLFRHVVFEFEGEVTPDVPVASAVNADVLELFDRQRLVPGKTVVLSPYSNTLFEVPSVAFWELVADRCAESGLTVCTNCGPTEQPVAGTTATQFPLRLAADFIETAGFFVGARSGFCDVISGTSSRKVVLYDRDARFFKGSYFEYFSLEAMGLGRNIFEYEFETGKPEDAMNEVMEALA